MTLAERSRPFWVNSEVLQFKTLQETVAEYLIKKIVVGQIAPGQKLNEQDLASYFNVSRVSLREAFQTLKNAHLVNYIPRRGVYVTDISVEDLKLIYESREMIECYAIDLLKNRGIKKLQNVVSYLESVQHLPVPPEDDSDEFYKYFKKIVGFHEQLIESTANYWVIDFYKSISYHLARYQFIYKLFFPEARNRSMNDHMVILNLIDANEYEKAQELMKQHIRYALDRLLVKISTTK